MLATAGDLIATGHFGEAAEMVWDGTKDTASKIIQGNITGKDGAAANLSSVLVGDKATKSLASGNYSVAAMQAITNTADGLVLCLIWVQVRWLLRLANHMLS